jgi:hypothetical protein
MGQFQQTCGNFKKGGSDEEGSVHDFCSYFVVRGGGSVICG